MKPLCHPKCLFVGVAVCLAAGLAWWGIAFRPDSQRLRPDTDTASPNMKDPPEYLAANSWEQREREARREEFNRILEAGVWPENCSNLLEFFRFLLDRNPALAVKFYNMAPGHTEKKDAILCIAGEWFRRDPSACIQWIISDPRWKDNNRSVVGRSILNAVENMNYNQHDISEVLGAVSRWAMSETERREKIDIELMKETALAAFGSQTEIGLIEDRMKRMGLGDEIHLALKGRARKEPSEILQYYEGKGEKMPDWVASGLVDGRIDEHPDLAFDYLAGQPWGLGKNTKERGTNVEFLAKKVMERYLEVDSMEASDRLSRMDPGRAKDCSIKAMAEWLARRGSKAEITPWLPAIQDPKVKQAVEQLAR